jgi:hypothetical protein
MAAQRAQDWVADEIMERGWEPSPGRERERQPGAVVACRAGLDPRVVAFFAHTDTVSEVPGANDNAAAVAVLLVAAQELRDELLPRRTCLVFPDGEERGLLGSRWVATARERMLGGLVDQVVALDLVGRGRLTHHGLGPPFGPKRLRALLAAAPAEVPWVYRALSQGRPLMERSDHAWFNLAGIPASHLMARAEAGVYFPYHTRDDTPDQLQVETLQAAVVAVMGIARMKPLPEEEGGPAIVVPWLLWVLPPALTWAVLGLGPLLGLLGASTIPRQKSSVELLAVGRWLGGQALAFGLVLGAAGLASVGRPWHLARTDWVVAAAWGAWGMVQAWHGAGSSPRTAEVGAGRGPAVVGVVAAITLTGASVAAGLPLLGVPFALTAGALGLRWMLPPPWQVLPALVTAWVPLYLVRADAVRELAHHTLLPAMVLPWAVVLTLVGLPMASVLQRPARGLVLPFLLLALSGIAGAWWTPEQQAPYVRGEVRD